MISNDHKNIYYIILFILNRYFISKNLKKKVIKEDKRIKLQINFK